MEFLKLDFNYWFLQTIAMAVTALVLPKLKITGPLGALTTVVALAFVNSKVWDAALFFQIPDTFSYQTLLLFLTNGIIFWILVKLLPGIEIEGFFTALLAPVIFTACSLIISSYGEQIDWFQVLDFIVQKLQTLRDFFKAEIAVPLNDVKISSQQ